MPRPGAQQAGLLTLRRLLAEVPQDGGVGIEVVRFSTCSSAGATAGLDVSAEATFAMCVTGLVDMPAESTADVCHACDSRGRYPARL